MSRECFYVPIGRNTYPSVFRTDFREIHIKELSSEKDSINYMLGRRIGMVNITDHPVVFPIEGIIAEQPEVRRGFFCWIVSRIRMLLKWIGGAV